MKDKSQMIAEMKTILKPYVQNHHAFETLDEDTDFINDLKVNSANLVDIILDIEDKYNIEIDNESMEKMLTVKTALEVVNEKLEPSQGAEESDDK